MIKLAELYSPHVLITRPPASFLKVTGDQKLRYDLEWPNMKINAAIQNLPEAFRPFSPAVITRFTSN